MYREQAIQKMTAYFDTDNRMVQHTLKVLAYSEEILQNTIEPIDNFIQQVIALASIYHDIGIPEALKKYGSAEPKYQEQEGMPVARTLLAEQGMRGDVLERVCYIVGNHHTREKVDGIDFQILWEADFLVNLQSGWLKLNDEIEVIINENFRTQTGIALAKKILQSEE